MGVLLVQQLRDLTDTQTVEALDFNVAWHPKVTEMGRLEFHRASEAIDAGEKAALAALPDLMSAVQQPDARR